MKTTNEFIKKRKTEIDEQIEQLTLERRQLVAAELVVAHDAARKRDQTSKQPETIKQQVVKILIDYPNGLDAKAIQAELGKRFNRHVKRESLSPQLSRLGADGTLEREHKLWILPIVDKALFKFKEDYDTRQAARKAQIDELVGELTPEEENPQDLHS